MLLFCLLLLLFLLSILFLKPNVRTYKNARNELANLEMGTIDLVIFSVCEVYRDGGYLQVVEECARLSMAKAAEEVKALPNYA